MKTPSITTGVLIFCAVTLPGVAPSAEDYDSLRPFFEKHCVQCHGEKKQKGDVRLDDVSAFDSELWENIYEQLAGEEMPPDDEPQPAESERSAMAKHALALAEEGSVPSATGFRRLNKREYGNTVRDLLGLWQGTFDPGEFIYADEINEGFDTAAEALIISNELLLEYMGAADKSLRHALFSTDREKPVAAVNDVSTRRMRGGSGRYATFSNSFAILRVGGSNMIYDGKKSRTVRVPGRYTITVTASGIDRDRYPVKFHPAEGPLILGVGVVPEDRKGLSSGGQIQQKFELKDGVEQSFTFDTWIDKDYFPYISFVNGSTKPITQIRANIRRGKLPKSAMGKPFVGPGIRVSEFKIEGPFHDEWPPESFRTTYDSGEIPDLENAGERGQLVQRFATRAFRRPVSPEEVAPYLDYLAKQHAETGDWRESIIRTFSALMASADFLYIREGEGKLSPHALASRLSYFFWSTMPDEELFELADSGKIGDPAVLRDQVTRLLNDPKSSRFGQSFTDQWLSLDILGTMPPDIKNQDYKVYHKDDLESAMLEETRRYFEVVLTENRSVRDFLDSDYTILNRGLATLYGVPFEGKEGWARVTFPADLPRGGLLGQGSILTLTSNGVDTSPVVRGHWVLDELLGTPPPPAPKEVPALVPDLNGAETIREQLERHRSDVACFECHRKMDPPGFALEAFDPIGRFRTRYSPKQIVTTDGRFLGKEFANIEEFKEILVSQIRPFARNLIVKISEYAKGRKLRPADFKVVEAILERAAADDYRMRDILVEISTSELMTHR